MTPAVRFDLADIAGHVGLAAPGTTQGYVRDLGQRPSHTAMRWRGCLIAAPPATDSTSAVLLIDSANTR